MATTTLPPGSGGDNPLPFVFDIRTNAALVVEPDHEFGVVVARLAAEPKVGAIMAPETALETARRLVAAVAALRRPPACRS